MPGRVLWPSLAPVGADIDPALLKAGQRAHTPYSRCPAAVQLTSASGESVIGLAIESVAFNPSVSPLQSALVEWLARGQDYQGIRTATLAQGTGGAVDHARSTAELLGRIAPDAQVILREWAI